MILTFDEQQTIKPVSANNAKRYPQINKEVQELELYKLFGPVFYEEILDNYDPLVNDKWKELVEGCTFDDYFGNTIKHKGLKHVLAYLIFAQYVTEISVVDTFTGMVQKTRNDSEQLSSGQLKNLQSHNREIAFNYFENVKLFLIENRTFFKHYCFVREKRVTGYKSFGVKRTKI